jgi:hypothetical protein
MAGPRTQPYFRGDDLPDCGLTWKQDGQLIDFSDPGWSFTVRLGTRSEPALVELSSVTGLATDPNIVITFADGDLDPLPVGVADGVVLAVSGGEQETMPFELPIHRTIDAPTPP